MKYIYEIQNYIKHTNALQNCFGQHKTNEITIYKTHVTTCPNDTVTTLVWTAKFTKK